MILMKKKIIIIALTSIMLAGCSSQKYGDITDFDKVNENSTDTHIVFASSRVGCYSDGSYFGNVMFEMSKKEIEKKYE